MMRRLGALLLILLMFTSACASSSGTAVDTAEAGSSDSSGTSDANDGDSSDGGSNDGDSNDADPNDADSTNGDDASSSSTDNDDAAEDTSSAQGAVADGATSMAASSPIGAFFADGGGFDAAIAEYTIRVEEEIVVCMAAQGFEFSRTTNQVNEVQQRQNELTIREWTNEYGFGISTSFDSIAQSQATDPNADILFSLSAAEREVWIETLTGGDGFGGGFDDVPLEEQGCIGAALIATGGQEAIEGIDTFSNAYEEGEEGLFDRREMIDAVDAWSRCMGESGFPGFSDRDDPEDEIRQRFDEVTAPMSAALEELTPEEGQALVSGESLDLADLPELDLDALRALQADEIKVAIVSLDCYELEVQATYEPLRDEFEKGLLVEYSTEFDALKNIGN